MEFAIIAAYFLPWVVAGFRGHRNRAPIAILNVALGWTLIGWLAALIWASTDNVSA